MAILHKRKEIIHWTVLLVLPLILAFAGVSLAGWDDYRTSSISAITAKHKSHFNNSNIPKDAPVLNIHPAGDPFRTSVIYLGKTRPIKVSRREFIGIWEKSAGIKTVKLNGMFNNEIQVREGDTTYWLPIQNVLIPHLTKEVKTNGQVTLFVRFIGTNQGDWVFLINEFQAL